MSMAFSNMVRATTEDRAAITNLIMANSTLTEKLELCANRLSTKEAYTMALQTSMKNLQGGIKNLKEEDFRLKKSGHYGSAGAVNKDNGRMNPRLKQEGQAHHPTWWSTTYCWSHMTGGHSGADYKHKSPGHKAEATETTRF